MLLDLIVSTLVFFAAMWGLRRFFDAQDIPAGMARSVMILVLATAASMASSSLLSWLLDEPDSNAQMMQVISRQAGLPVAPR